MIIRHIDREDLAQTRAFLDDRYETSMYLLHNMARRRLGYRGRPNEATYLGVFRDGVLLGLASHTWRNTLIIQAPSPDALHMLEDLPRLLDRPLEGLLGPREQCLELMARLSLERSDAALDLEEPVYVLNLRDTGRARPLRLSGTTFREAGEADIPTLVAWRVSYLEQVTLTSPSPQLQARAEEEVRLSVAEQRTYIVEHRGQIVATSALGAIGSRAAQLGNVFTSATFRDRGMGRMVITGALEVAKERLGLENAVVMIDDSNLAALTLCETLGFVRVGRYSFTYWGPEGITGLNIHP